MRAPFPLATAPHNVLSDFQCDEAQMLFEYKVIPAPEKGIKAKGVKAPEARFALILQDVMNQHAAEGWEYQRAEALPSQERAGLTSSATVFRNVLVFRRAIEIAPEPQVQMDPAQAHKTTDEAGNIDSQPVEEQENYPV